MRDLFFWVLFFAVENAWAESYEVVGSSVRVGELKVCILDRVPRYAIESFDKSAVMLSETDYVDRRELDRCRAGGVVHVLSISSRVGVLSDINISKGIYVALDFVGTRPFVYLAAVAHVGSSKNLVSLRGSYVAGRKISELRGRLLTVAGRRALRSYLMMAVMFPQMEKWIVRKHPIQAYGISKIIDVL